jgi:hypothetical protein
VAGIVLHDRVIGCSGSCEVRSGRGSELRQAIPGLSRSQTTTPHFHGVSLGEGSDLVALSKVKKLGLGCTAHHFIASPGSTI